MKLKQFEEKYLKVETLKLAFSDQQQLFGKQHVSATLGSKATCCFRCGVVRL